MSTVTVYWIAHYSGDPDTTVFVGGSGVRTDNGIRADIVASNHGNPSKVQIMENYGAETVIEMVEGNQYIFAPKL
jgi:hypothetical protein